MKLVNTTTDEKRKILIVDDLSENLILLVNLLGDHYELAVAKSGEQALEILEEQQDIDLILLDIVMPNGIDGYEVCRRIKASIKTQHIPVIFLTGLNDSGDETKGLQVGGADYIVKPFKMEVVMARIQTQLSLIQEQEKSRKLLEILLPLNVIEELNSKGEYTPVMHENVSILFCDLVGFTEISTGIPATKLVSELSDIFTEFDKIMTKNDCMRIKTIGDGYMAVCGVLETKNHADKLVNAGLEMIEFLESRAADIPWKCRIGINSGKAISGVIGNQRFQFDLLGDDVNMAARVESNAPVMSVAVTNSTLQKLSHELFEHQSLGQKNLKGKGEVELYAISRLKLATSKTE